MNASNFNLDRYDEILDMELPGKRVRITWWHFPEGLEQKTGVVCKVFEPVAEYGDDIVAAIEFENDGMKDDIPVHPRLMDAYPDEPHVCLIFPDTVITIIED